MKCNRCGQPFIPVINSSSQKLCWFCQRDNNDIDRLIEQGHTFHCACGIVFGGQDCTCGGNNKNTPEEKRERLKSLYDLVKDA